MYYQLFQLQRHCQDLRRIFHLACFNLLIKKISALENRFLFIFLKIITESIYSYQVETFRDVIWHPSLLFPPCLLGVTVMLVCVIISTSDIMFMFKGSLKGKVGARYAAAVAAKSLQSCPTLCNSIHGSPPGSPVPGILQARILEWVAMSSSNA